MDGNDGTALDPTVWSAGALPKRRHDVRDLALLLGPPAICTSGWVHGPVAVVNAEDVAQWPYTLGLLVGVGCFFRILALACWWSGSWGWWCLLC